MLTDRYIDKRTDFYARRGYREYSYTYVTETYKYNIIINGSKVQRKHRRADGH